MSLDPARDETWEWHRPHESDVEYLQGQGTAGTIVRSDPDEPPTEYAKALLAAAPEMLSLLRRIASAECFDCAARYHPCVHEDADALLGRLPLEPTE